ncbi:hypothetical protein BGZ95_006296 [Linnemannia exigua]|uniref:Uncharacterized protein n=1 Tax=Linnemannia exigua TaxID=604196 RepID=A0AAD4DG32_9FUNG|nr:hypothetical protein BGZ95_006296 [Linnemannia exigua]
MDTTTTTAINPFDLPELRDRLSRFIPVQDALSCIFLSKAWSHEFVSAIWFKVDFNVHPLFAHLPADIIAKHGHLIRIVENAETPAQSSILNHANVNKLRRLQMQTSASTMQQVNAFQIVARNNSSLRDVDLIADVHRYNIVDKSTHHVSASAFVPFFAATPGRLSSPLESLDLTSLWLKHDELLTILEASPGLSKLRLTHTDVVGTPTRFFQHPGITLLSTSLKSIVPEVSTGLPSLLSYVPNLTTLQTWHSDSSAIPPSARIKKAFERYCPLLKQFKLGGNSVNTIPEFFTNIVSNVTRITFPEARMTSKTIAAIVLHQASMIKVAQFYANGFNYDEERVPEVLEYSNVSGEMMQEIPRKCSHLQRLNLHRHEMDMDVVESGEWKCKDLRKLRIRVKGLDTKEKILRTIALWRAGCWRRWQKKATGIDIGVVEEEERLKTDQSIEARVARHLLKFEQLWWVWLGYQMWTPI